MLACSLQKYDPGTDLSFNVVDSEIAIQIYQIFKRIHSFTENYLGHTKYDTCNLSLAYRHQTCENVPKQFVPASPSSDDPPGKHALTSFDC